MRVIAGSAKRINLVTPAGLNTRPTTDRIKETLFSMIQFDLVGSRFLDLFSGSGAMGIEALSRGAQEVIFVEKDKEALSCIKDNLKRTSLLDKGKILSSDVQNALDHLGSCKEKFHVIFMDPPYKEDLVIPTLESIKKNKLLVEQGYVIVEHDSDWQVDARGFDVIKTKSFRATTMTFLELNQEEA